MDEVQQKVLDTQRMMWSLGDYSRNVGFLRPAALHLVETCKVGTGHRFLDVGAGTGNLAVEAAHAGASVIATDPTEHLMDIGRKDTAEASLDIEWQEADAQNLPFEDNTFDVVGSVMGAMFAPDADAAVREMMRVTKPGGFCAMTSWAKDGMIGQTFLAASRFMPPPPPGVNTVGEWGDEATARSRFERYSEEVSVLRGKTMWAFESLEEERRFFEEEAPPGVAAKMVLPPETFAELVVELEKIHDRFDKSPGDDLLLEAEYLLTVARKPGS